MKTISPSQMHAMACRQRHFWQYSEGYKPKFSGINLELGDGIHAALEAFYKSKIDITSSKNEPDIISYFLKYMDDKFKMADLKFDDDIAKFKEGVELGKVMLKGYLEEYDHGRKDEFDVIYTEKTLSRPLPIPNSSRNAKCNVVVRLDGLVRDHKTKKLFSLEHKTYSAYDEIGMERDPQFTAQVWVGQSLAKQIGLNESVVGVIYNGLRKQRPSKKITAPLFRRTTIYRNENQIKSFLYAAYWLYRESLKWKVFPQPSTRECAICDFQKPCLELIRGGDYQYLLNENYLKRRPRKKE